MEDPKYPDCHVQLTGHDGNAFAVMGRVQEAMKQHLRDDLEMDREAVKEEVDAYIAESTSGDYDHLLRTAMKWVTVS